MTINVEIRDKTHTFAKRCMSVKKIFEELELSPQSYLAVKDGELLTEDLQVMDGETITIISVISGG